MNLLSEFSFFVQCLENYFVFVIIQKIQHPKNFDPIVNLRGKQGVEGGTHRERKKWHRLFLNKATI